MPSLSFSLCLRYPSISPPFSPLSNSLSASTEYSAPILLFSRSSYVQRRPPRACTVPCISAHASLFLFSSLPSALALPGLRCAIHI
jgi:hypothetical protein